MNKNIIIIDLYFYDGGYQVRKDRERLLTVLTALKKYLTACDKICL